jgi:hypothetical protein
VVLDGAGGEPWHPGLHGCHSTWGVLVFCGHETVLAGCRGLDRVVSNVGRSLIGSSGLHGYHSDR